MTLALASVGGAAVGNGRKVGRSLADRARFHVAGNAGDQLRVRLALPLAQRLFPPAEQQRFNYFQSNPVVEGGTISCEGGFPAAKESSTPFRAPVSTDSGGSLLRNAAERAAPAASSSIIPPRSPDLSAFGQPARQPKPAPPKKSAPGGQISADPPTQPVRQAEAPCRRSARPSDDWCRGCGRSTRSSCRKRKRAAWSLASPDTRVPISTG